MSHITSSPSKLSQLLGGLFLSVLVSLIYPTLALAASPTPSPSPSSTPKASPRTTPQAASSPISSPSAEVTTQKLKERIERIVEEKREQVKGALDQLRTRRRGIVGEVTRVSAETITVKTSRTTVILPLNKDVSMVKGKKPISVDDVAVGDWIVAIGSEPEDDFVPEHLVIVSTSLRPVPRVITLGNVESVTKTQVVVSPRAGGEARTYTLGKNTVYQDSTGNKVALKDITTSMSVLVIGTTNDANVTTATLVQLLGTAATP